MRSRIKKMAYSQIKPDWAGHDGIVICGGSSVTKEICEAIKGLNTLPINSMYAWLLDSPCMFFADNRWWTREIKKWPQRLEAFKGTIYTTSISSKGHPGLTYLRRVNPPQCIVNNPGQIGMARSSLSAGLGILRHKGVKRIFIFGADNSYGAGKRAHCHSEHPWKRTVDTWKVKTAELQYCVSPLRALGIEVYNCSMSSTLPFWPKKSAEEAISMLRR
jgi:hypothetical protein